MQLEDFFLPPLNVHGVNREKYLIERNLDTNSPSDNQTLHKGFNVISAVI